MTFFLFAIWFRSDLIFYLEKIRVIHVAASIQIHIKRTIDLKKSHKGFEIGFHGYHVSFRERRGGWGKTNILLSSLLAE